MFWLISIECSIGSLCKIVSRWCFHSASIIAITTLRGDLIKTVLLVCSSIYRYRISVLQRIPHFSDWALQRACSFSLNNHEDSYGYIIDVGILCRCCQLNISADLKRGCWHYYQMNSRVLINNNSKKNNHKKKKKEKHYILIFLLWVDITVAVFHELLSN